MSKSGHVGTASSSGSSRALVTSCRRSRDRRLDLWWRNTLALRVLNLPLIGIDRHFPPPFNRSHEGHEALLQNPGSPAELTPSPTRGKGDRLCSGEDFDSQCHSRFPTHLPGMRLLPTVPLPALLSATTPYTRLWTIALREFGRRHRLPKLGARNRGEKSAGAVPVHNVDFCIIHSHARSGTHPLTPNDPPCGNKEARRPLDPARLAGSRKRYGRFGQPSGKSRSDSTRGAES